MSAEDDEVKLGRRVEEKGEQRRAEKVVRGQACRCLHRADLSQLYHE